MSALCYLKNDTTGVIFDKKLQLLNLENLDGLSFHSSLDRAQWITEPSESLSFLYKKRAQQIRDSYDYIVMYFSGGSDSITMLNAFIKNNINIDEVIVYVNTDTEDVSLNGISALKVLRSMNFNNKITAVNIDIKLLKQIVEDRTWQTYHSFSGLIHSFYRFRISFYEEHGYIKPNQRNGRVAHLFGGTFPKVCIESDKVYSCVNFKQFMVSSLDPENVQFFADESMLELYVKQCYVLARKLIELDEKESDEVQQYKLAIRDEYKEQLSLVKNRGNTKARNFDIHNNTQHHRLHLLCGGKRFPYNERVLDYFKSIEKLSFGEYEKKYFMFHVRGL